MPGVSQRYPLREWGWGVEDVWRYLAQRGITIPARTDCAWCYGQRIIEWKRLWEQHPEVYAEAEAMEAETGHTFRSAGRDTWPAPLKELRAEFERGRKVKGERRVELSMFDEPEQGKCRVCSL
jgi:3'-phosphoadenosine 5'-phosphosulfate sulfotransferase (PAPS reductase)/FAD synthetase